MENGLEKQDITFAQANEIRRQVVDQLYQPNTLAKALAHQYGQEGKRTALNSIAVWSMGIGHMALARSLVQLGADPKGPLSKHFGLDGFQEYHTSLDQAPSLPYLLATQASGTMQKAIASPGNLARPRQEVLAYVLAHPDVWHADVNAKHRGSTPLVAAQAAGNAYSRYMRETKSKHPRDPVELRAFQETLIKAGADINKGGKRHNLLEASIPDYCQGEPDFSELDKVLEWGVDPKAFGASAWARAICEDVEIRYQKKAAWGPRARALAARGIELYSPANAPSQGSPLYQAVAKGMRPAVEQLIRDGADPCWIDPDRQWTLLSANPDPRGHTLDMLKLFPAHAFDAIIDRPDAQGDTPLHGAVNAMNIPMVEFLLDRGANLHALNKKKQKPLQALKRSGTKAQSKFDALLAVLLPRGVDLGGDKFSSAMHKAGKMLSPAAVRYLVQQGHDPNAHDKRKQTPAQLVLVGHQAHASAQFNVPRGISQVATLQALAEAGVEMSAPLHGGTTLLHEAVARGCHVAAMHLLQAGVDPHVKNENGDTPMHVWTKAYRYYMAPQQVLKNQGPIAEMMEAFIRAGANMALPGSDGSLPFEAVRHLPAVQSALARAQLEMQTPSVQASTPSGRMRL